MDLSTQDGGKVGSVASVVVRTYGRGVRESHGHKVGGQPIHTVIIKVPGIKGSAFVGSCTKGTYTGAKGGPNMAGKGR